MSNIEPTPFGDKYVLVEHIATGGMAEIYRATYSGIEGFAKELVIKRLREEFAERPNVVRMSSTRRASPRSRSRRSCSYRRSRRECWSG